MTEQSQKEGTMELVAPAGKPQAIEALGRTASLAALSPWEQHKMQWQMRRQRGQLVQRLAQMEMQTVLAEAVQLGEQRMDVAQEQALLAVYEEQVACLLQAGRLRDEAVVEAMKLTVGSSELVADAIDQVTGGYVSRMEKRARGGGC
jgi:hypothetical protein